MIKEISSIPLEYLVTTDKNMYELTNAAIHRASQITVAGSDESEETGGKIVSQAIKEIVTGGVQYNIRQE